MNKKQAEDSKYIGFQLLMNIVSLSRSGKSYKNELKKLKPYLEKYPEVQSLANRLRTNLEK